MDDLKKQQNPGSPTNL